MDRYTLRIWLIRITFVLILALCVFLIQAGFTDYVILVSILVVFLGIFTTSKVDLEARGIRIRKSYFWALVTLRKELSFAQILSIKQKDYLIERPEHTWLDYFTDDYRTLWTTTKLHYLDNGITRSIEVQIDKGVYSEIARRIRHNVQHSL